MEEKQAYFKGTNNNIYNVEIRKEKGNYLIINAYDKKGNEVGYMYIYKHPDNRLYLDVIYCYDKYYLGIYFSFLNFNIYYLKLMINKEYSGGWIMYLRKKTPILIFMNRLYAKLRK